MPAAIPSCKKIPCDRVITAKEEALRAKDTARNADREAKKAHEIAHEAKGQAMAASYQADAALDKAEEAGNLAKLNKKTLGGLPFFGVLTAELIFHGAKAWGPAACTMFMDVVAWVKWLF